MSALYVEQYHRMRRWYQKFSLLDQGREHNALSENYVDEIYAFFMNCYHLKDWIKNDGSITIPAIKRDVEDLINTNENLGLCADLCNSLKHLENNNRSGKHPKFAKKEYGLSLGATAASIRLKYTVNHDNGPIDAFQLATKCVTAWDLFLSAKGLEVPSAKEDAAPSERRLRALLRCNFVRAFCRLFDKTRSR